MKKIAFFLLFVLFLVFNTIYVKAQHTFSIVAVDPATGEIGSAGATCISAEDGALAISDIVLGVGVIHTQAWWSPTNQNNARARMEAGDTPQEIIDWLVANDYQNNPSLRQYGVVDLNGGNPRSAAYTGTNTDDVKLHVTGPNYAIQGNILISEDVIYDMETAFLNTTGTLADKLMAALQGAKRIGADSRCEPFGISSASAFLRVADPSDTDSSYGNLSLDLNVWIEPGSPIFEPIDALQDAYNATLSNNGNDQVEVSIFPNPTHKTLYINTGRSMIKKYEVLSITGQLLHESSLPILSNRFFIDVNQPIGIYFIRFIDEKENTYTKKVIIE
ncbi:MAG: DUF1028 domain-containing protein [Flavobacteriaceae bacterium]